MKAVTQDIVVDEVFPHPPETIWKTLTTGALIARWLTPTNDTAFQHARWLAQDCPEHWQFRR